MVNAKITGGIVVSDRKFQKDIRVYLPYFSNQTSL